MRSAIALCLFRSASVGCGFEPVEACIGSDCWSFGGAPDDHVFALSDAGVDAGRTSSWSREDAGWWVAGSAERSKDVDCAVGGGGHPLGQRSAPDRFGLSVNGESAHRRTPFAFGSVGVGLSADDPSGNVGSDSGLRCPPTRGGGRIAFSGLQPTRLAGAFAFDCVNSEARPHVHRCFRTEQP